MRNGERANPEQKAREMDGLIAEILDHSIAAVVDPGVYDKISKWMMADLGIPPGVPPRLGVKFYNDSLQRLIPKYVKASFFPKKKRERGQLMSAMENYIQTFRAMVDRAIDGEKPTERDIEILKSATPKRGTLVNVMKDDKTGRFSPAIWENLPLVTDVLWLWVYWIWNGDIKINRCKAHDCNKIFVPKRSDQEYCSVNCRTRAFHQRKKHIRKDGPRMKAPGVPREGHH